MDAQPSLTSQARVATVLPRRYLSQLCKHFEHRLPVTLAEANGTISFPDGLCTLTAEADALVMSVTAANADALAKLEDVVARHLLRFAFRDPPTISWSAAA